MKMFLKTAGALCALTMMGTTAAKADYVIMKDTSFPSVVYFQFDEPVAQEPAIITVPEQAQSPVAGVFPPAPAPAADSMAAVDPIVMAPSSNGDIETSGPISFNERLNENADKSPDQIAQERAEQFDSLSGPELEQAVEDAIVEDAIFSDVGLR